MTTTQTFKIVGNYTELAPLYVQYQGQTSPQDAYIEIDPQDGTLHASYNAEIGNAVPFSVWHNQVKRVSCPNTLKSSAIVPYIEAVAEIVTPASEGYSCEWNGNNHVGNWPNWDEDTDRKLEELYYEWQENENVNVMVWEAGEWLTPESDNLNITSETTDEELSALESQIEEDAKEQDVILTGLSFYLRSLRDYAE